MLRPPHAAIVWVVDDWVYFELPGTRGIKSHTIRLPATESGFKAGLQSLRARTENSTIGTGGDPTQHQIRKALKEFKDPIQTTRKKYSPALLEAAKAILQEKGMIK